MFLFQNLFLIEFLFWNRCVVLYVYFFGVAVLIPQNLKAAIVWSCCGSALSFAILGLAYFEIHHYSVKARKKYFDPSVSLNDVTFLKFFITFFFRLLTIIIQQLPAELFPEENTLNVSKKPYTLFRRLAVWR